MPEIQVQERASPERPICVSCRGELGSNDAALACTECAVPLHWGCWRGLQRCPTAGCEGKAKHSDRLTAQLAEWGPAAPLVRDAEQPDPKAGQSFAPVEGFQAATKPAIEPKPERPPQLPSPESLGELLNHGYDSRLPLRDRATLVAVYAGGFLGGLGFLGAVIYGGLIDNHRQPMRAVAYGVTAALVGVVAGLAVGAIQLLVGARDP